MDCEHIGRKSAKLPLDDFLNVFRWNILQLVGVHKLHHLGLQIRMQQPVQQAVLQPSRLYVAPGIPLLLKVVPL